MLNLTAPPHRFCDGLSRRTFLRVGALGLGGASLPQILSAGDTAMRRGQKSVIMVYLPGGPPHIDLYDQKPDAPLEVRGPFRSIQTNLPGLRICELLPRLAQKMDKFVLIRSLVGGFNRHESFQCYAGRPGGRPEDGEPAGGWPTFGSVVSKLQGPRGGVPAYVDAGPRMVYTPYNNTGLHDNAPRDSWPGFLGFDHTPLQLEGKGKDDLILGDISSDRFGDRKALLAALDEFRRRVDSDPALNALDSSRRQAFDILTSSKLAEAFDLEREDPRVRERYGEAKPTTNGFGAAPKSPQHLLLARRLVEAGVRCVTVAFGAWDWHANRGGTLEKLARADLPDFDHALSVFIEDLDERNLLDDVTVVVWGEFGRTPKFNKKGGRDHWPNVSCVLMAGGGMRVGQVIGGTDQHGAEVTTRPLHFQEVFATIYHNLGIDTRSATVKDLAGRPHYLVDGGFAPIPEVI